MPDCQDPNIPVTDNTACECINGIHPSNCVNMSEANAYLNIKAGDNLTVAAGKIEAKMKTNATKAASYKRPYKTIELLLTQTGTTAPTKVEFEKGVAATISTAYTSAGKYTITASNAFAGTVSIQVGVWNKEYNEQVRAYKVDDNTIAVETGTDNNFNIDGILDSTPIIIKIKD